MNARDYEGRTALMIASYDGNSGTAQVLVDAGADVNVGDNDGKTALSYVYDRQWNGFVWKNKKDFKRTVHTLKRAGATK